MNIDGPIDVRIGPLDGLLAHEPAARGLVIFAHGSGSSRLSPRNAHVAEALHKVGLATLLLDLLTQEESLDRANVFDVELLARRLTLAADWSRREPNLATLPIGYFGASTGAAAALIAAATDDQPVAAVVSRGGRPDLAGPALDDVRAPTLLLVGSRDPEVLALNRAALKRLQAPKELIVVQGASHLFEEPGTLDEVVRNAVSWFTRHLGVFGESRHARALP
jgi:dienelactone hydrolase